MKDWEKLEYITMALFNVLKNPGLEIILKYNLKTSNSLDYMDNGIDFYEIKNNEIKSIYQCKYRDNHNLKLDDLKTFLNYCDKLKDVNKYLVINKECKISKKICDIILSKNIKIIMLDFEFPFYSDYSEYLEEFSKTFGLKIPKQNYIKVNNVLIPKVLLHKNKILFPNTSFTEINKDEYVYKK